MDSPVWAKHDNHAKSGALKVPYKGEKTMKTLTPIMGAMLFVSVSIASAQELSCFVNGRLVQFEGVQPLMINNRVMIPVRGVFEELGASVSWSASNATVTATNGITTIYMVIGDHTAIVNNERVYLDCPPAYQENRVLIPVRFVSEAFNAKVEWNLALQTVQISTGYRSNSGSGSLFSLISGQSDRIWD